MSTGQTWQIESTSSDDTLALGEQIGRRLRGSEVIELIGDLGSGKTTFVKGLAKGMGSTDRVHSPSFNLENVYKSDHLTLHHFDFYRVCDTSIMEAGLEELIGDNRVAIVIEWPRVAKERLSQKRPTVISISTSGEQSRKLSITSGQNIHLMPVATSN